MRETMTAEQRTSFRYELEKLINRESRENGSNTPDFILAEYLTESLQAFDRAVARREEWYGRDPKRGLGMRTVRSRRAERNHALLSSINPAERARILATPVEELADEIVRERERAAPGYLVDAHVTYARAIASFAANYGALRELRRYGQCLALPTLPAPAAVVPRREVWCGGEASACREHLFDAPNLRRSVCGRCGRVVDWEAARQ